MLQYRIWAWTNRALNVFRKLSYLRTDALFRFFWIKQRIQRLESLDENATRGNIRWLWSFILQLNLERPNEYELAAHAFERLLRFIDIKYVRDLLYDGNYHIQEDCLFENRRLIAHVYKIYQLTRIFYPDSYHAALHRQNMVSILWIHMNHLYQDKKSILSEIDMFVDCVKIQEDVDISNLENEGFYFSDFIEHVLKSLADVSKFHTNRDLIEVLYKDHVTHVFNTYTEPSAIVTNAYSSTPLRERINIEPSITFYIDEKHWTKILDLTHQLNMTPIQFGSCFFGTRHTQGPSGLIAFAYAWATMESSDTERAYAQWATDLKMYFLNRFKERMLLRNNVGDFSRDRQAHQSWLYIRGTLSKENVLYRISHHFIGEYWAHQFYFHEPHPDNLWSMCKSLLLIHVEAFASFRKYIERHEYSFRDFFWAQAMLSTTIQLQEFINHYDARDLMEIPSALLHSCYRTNISVYEEHKWLTHAWSRDYIPEDELLNYFVLYNQFFYLYSQLHAMNTIHEFLGAKIALFHFSRIAFYTTVLCTKIASLPAHASIHLREQMQKCVLYMQHFANIKYGNTPVEKLFQSIAQMDIDDLALAPATKKLLRLLFGDNIFNSTFIECMGSNILEWCEIQSELYQASKVDLRPLTLPAEL